jgi:hypothetical protein
MAGPCAIAGSVIYKRILNFSRMGMIDIRPMNVPLFGCPQNLAGDALGPFTGVQSPALLPLVAAFAVGHAVSLEILAAHVLHGVGRHHEIAGRAHRVDHLQGQVVGIHLDALEHLAGHADDLVVDDELLVGHGQHGLQHAGAVVHVIGAAHGAQQDGHGLFPPGLGIGQFGIGQPAEL